MCLSLDPFLDAEEAAAEKYKRMYNACLLDKAAGVGESIKTAIKKNCAGITREPSFLGEQLAFTWENEITEKNDVYTSSGKSFTDATINNTRTTKAVQDVPSPEWIEEETIEVTITYCSEENNLIWVNQTWTRTGARGGKGENVIQVIVNKDTIFQTLRSRPVGSDQSYAVW